jgi:hypothetical protein
MYSQTDWKYASVFTTPETKPWAKTLYRLLRTSPKITVEDRITTMANLGFLYLIDPQPVKRYKFPESDRIEQLTSILRPDMKELDTDGQQKILQVATGNEDKQLIIIHPDGRFGIWVIRSTTTASCLCQPIARCLVWVRRGSLIPNRINLPLIVLQNALLDLEDTTYPNTAHRYNRAELLQSSMDE